MSALLALLLAASPGAPPPRGEEVFGALGVHLIERGESLVELATTYDVGFNELASANPHLDAFVPRAGAVALVPTAWILPRAARPGTIAVNLSEMRLYLARAAGEPPVTFPIGVAMEGHATPLGVHRVIEKTVAPTWYPTPAILEEDPTLPVMVPPGPENPLGGYALRLSLRTILIHGTNRPFAVGRKVSHGCIRMYEDDIRRLFRLVDVGTRVSIVREPVKVGVRDGRVYVEVHDDDALSVDLADEAVRLLAARGVLRDVDPRRLVSAVRAKRGIPVNVTAARE